MIFTGIISLPATASALLSNNPAFPDIAQAESEQADTKNGENRKIQGKGQAVPAMHGPVQHIGAIGQGQYIGKRLEKDRQFIDGKKESTQEHHGKAEKVGEGLGFENLAHRHGDEKAQKCGCNGDQQNCRDER